MPHDGNAKGDHIALLR